MEIDKKIVVKLIQVLEDLKKSLKGIEIADVEDSPEKEVVSSKASINFLIIFLSISIF